MYNPQSIRDFYDRAGAKEWERHERTLQSRIRYTIHRVFLERYAPAGGRVLDAGCGPGRFALDLARRGACLTLVDLSPVQLELARGRLLVAGLLDSVEAFHCLDMTGMAVLPDASFDVVVCYGAALSYTCERYDAALGELVRVLRPGGRLLVSVASLYGTSRLVGPYDEEEFLNKPDSHLDWAAVLSGEDIVYTRPESPEWHQPMVLFTSPGLRQALAQAGLRVTAMAAANPLVSEGAQIPRISDSQAASAALTELELALCEKPGLLDTGEHLLAAAEKV